MRIERKHSNTGIVNTKVFLQGFVEYIEFFHDQFFRDLTGNFTNRHVSRYQSYTEVILQQDHQRFLSFSHPFFNVFRMTGEMKIVRLNGVFIDRSCYQHVKISFLIFLKSTFQCIQCSFSRFSTRSGQFHLQFISRAVDNIHTSVLCLRSRRNNTEVRLNIHRLTMICSHFGRSINNRRAKFQHYRIGKSFQNNFIADAINISVGDTHLYLTFFHSLLFLISVVLLLSLLSLRI